MYMLVIFNNCAAKYICVYDYHKMVRHFVCVQISERVGGSGENSSTKMLFIRVHVCLFLFF